MRRERHVDRLVVWLALYAAGACAVSVVSGGAASLAYVADGRFLRATGLSLQHLRPIHEAAAFGWIFLGGAAVVYSWLRGEHGPFPPATSARFRAHLALWALAGVGIVASVLGGRLSGREYLGYHPIFSTLIVGGWLLFAVNWFGLAGVSLRGRPVYVHMWTVAILLFPIAYLESHLYLLESLSRRPLRDLAVQWKSAGVLVGSFNLLAYGALIQVSERLHGDSGYARSRTAFALFWVGLLNTFTNYGHHTYHLPQSPWIHWIAFVVSMLEIVILGKVGLDVVRGRVRTRPGVPDAFLRSASRWALVLLGVAILISIPPINTMIHGTHVVVAHSMGSMIGIDSMILWGAIALLVRERVGSHHPVVSGRRVRWAVAPLNASVAVFLAAFLVRGLAAGWTRYAGASAPDLSAVAVAFPYVLTGSGFAVLVLVLWILAQWAIALVATLRPSLRRVELGRPIESGRSAS